MSAASMVVTVIKSSPHLALLSLNILWMYGTLNRRVNKTRKAFEKQLIKQGMSREDAKRISGCFEELKTNIAQTLKQGVAWGLRQR
jgi:hypothetical protein